MPQWNIPPRAKILQALSINASNEIKWINESIADINGLKVHFDKKNNAVYLDESESYLSSEAMAMLIAKDILPNNIVIGSNLASFNWNSYKEEYSKAEVAAKEALSQKGISEREIDAFLQFFIDGIMKNGFKVLKIAKNQTSLIQ